MTRRIVYAASVLTGLWLGAAHANEPPRGPDEPRHFGPGPGMAMPLRQADADKDGRITRAEIDAMLTARFRKADANGDKALDQAEFASAMPKPPPPPEPPPEGAPPFPGRPFDPATRFGATDWNGDGKVSPDEFAIPIKAMAIHADRNGDGVIEDDELQRPPRGPRPPHGPRPPEPQ